MKPSLTIETVDTHTEGQPTRIIVSGVAALEGQSQAEKLASFRRDFDHVRKLLLSEPRGHRDMYGAVLTEPCRDDSRYGLFFMDNEGYMNMCGHGTIGVVAALIDTRRVSEEDATRGFRFDTPCGPVDVSSRREAADRTITFHNVPSFVERVGAELQLPGLGTIRVDVAYGGNYFVFFEASSMGMKFQPANTRAMIGAALKVRDAANDQLPVSHPSVEASRINIATLRGPTLDPSSDYRNLHVFGTGQFDRSPGGTATSARLAVLHSQGQIAIGDKIVVENLSGGLFEGRLIGETSIGEKPAVETAVTGRAFVTGLHRFILDPADPFKEGFLIG